MGGYDLPEDQRNGLRVRYIPKRFGFGVWSSEHITGLEYLGSSDLVQDAWR